MTGHWLIWLQYPAPDRSLRIPILSASGGFAKPTKPPLLHEGLSLPSTHSLCNFRSVWGLCIPLLWSSVSFLAPTWPFPQVKIEENLAVEAEQSPLPLPFSTGNTLYQWLIVVWWAANAEGRVHAAEGPPRPPARGHRPAPSRRKNGRITARRAPRPGIAAPSAADRHIRTGRKRWWAATSI